MANIRYFKSVDNPHASSVDFYARGEAVDDPVNHSILYPTAEVSLLKGAYDYGSTSGTNPDYIHHNKIARPGEQLKLFDAQPSSIIEAFSDYRTRAQTPTVLGMAVNEAKKLGMGLTYSYDLSKHSSKLAKKGLDLGVVEPNPSNTDAHQSNDIAERTLNKYQHTHTRFFFDDFNEISPDEVNAGRATIRGIVKQGIDARRGAKPQGTTKPLGPQFNTNNEQLKLPGFD